MQHGCILARSHFHLTKTSDDVGVVRRRRCDAVAMSSQDLLLIGCTLFGVLAGALLGLIPAVHVYSAAALAVSAPLLAHGPPGATAFLCLGLLLGWVFVGNVPSVYLFAPDEGAATAVLPATRMLLQGRGGRALRLLVLGALAGLITLAALAPVADAVLRPLLRILQPHTAWMVCAVIVFLVLGEWPRVDETHTAPLRRLAAAWAYLGAGQLTFWLSGLLGMVLMYRSPLPLDAAQQNLLPAFTGLFTLPGLLQILLFGKRPPPQSGTESGDAPGKLLRGALIGLGGGLFAAVLPVVSGGIGSLFAGHASAQRDDEVFLIAQGASRTVYMTGGFLLLFLPGVAVVRGGMASLIASHDAPDGWTMFWLAIAATLLGGIVAAALTLACGRAVGGLLQKIAPRAAAAALIPVALAATWAFTDVAGLGVAGVAACIGMIPVLGGGRRMNALGVLLVPVSLNLAGVGTDVAQFMGLSSFP
jgi:putative membrane protein